MGCITDCLKCLSAGIGVLILLTATLGISITNVVIGAININSNCTGIDQIPAYLITTGVLGLVSVLLHASIRDSGSKDDDSEKKNDSIFLQLIQIAHFGVLIWGSVILFDTERPVCDRVLFDYAFWSTITAYIILAVLFLIFCCTISSVFCQACFDHCCGDGEGELKYECKCCGHICCSDDVTKAEKQKKEKNKSSDVVIDMNCMEMPRISTLDRGTEC